MPIGDYAHWNEEAPRIWWEEEGKHDLGPSDPDPEDPGYYDYDDGYVCQDAPDECIREGNFNSLGDGRWLCSTCEETVVIETPDGTFVPWHERREITQEQIDLYRRERF